MFKLKAIVWISWMAIAIVGSGFAQNFEYTNLSSTKPFYAKDPYIFEKSESYAISFKTNPEIIKALVPEPLIPISSDQITFAFAKHHLVHPFRLNYNEAFFYILVSYGETVGIYMPVLYLDKIEGIIPGREIMGYNKVGADFEITETENKISIVISQMDTVIIKAAFDLGQSFVPPKEPPNAPVINLKFIPSAEKNVAADVNKLIISSMQDKKTLEMKAGTAKLELLSSTHNPLDKIPILNIDKVGYSKSSFKLSYGNVLYDYLKEAK